MFTRMETWKCILEKIIWDERAIYENNCHNQDKRALKDNCEKDFPTHSGLTPGLYLMTCGCKQRSVYGFSMMLTHESPSLLFDIITTRFESDYNPHIIYDASCLAMEYGYNRELKRYMSLNITTDRFHEANQGLAHNLSRAQCTTHWDIQILRPANSQILLWGE